MTHLFDTLPVSGFFLFGCFLQFLVELVDGGHGGLTVLTQSLADGGENDKLLSMLNVNFYQEIFNRNKSTFENIFNRSTFDQNIFSESTFDKNFFQKINF